MEQLTVKEAIEQGYLYYFDEGMDNCCPLDLNETLEPGERFLFDKEPQHPGTSAQNLFELVSEHIRDNTEFYDEDDQTIDAVKDAGVNWEELADKINAALQSVSYYEPTKIKLIP